MITGRAIVCVFALLFAVSVSLADEVTETDDDAAPLVPDAVPDIVAEFQSIIDETADNPAQIKSVERHAFYRETKNSYCVVQTAETRLYGNIILSKGIVPPE